MNLLRPSSLFLPVLFAALVLRAQPAPNVPPNVAAQIMVPQPPVDVASPVTVAAAFDPPAVLPGEKSFYRVTLGATESSIEWPTHLPFPGRLRCGAGACGQVIENLPNNFHPLTTFVYPVTGGRPGHFTVPGFTVTAYGRPVAIPAAGLDVVTDATNAGAPPRQVILETSATNLYVGQAFQARVLLPARPPNSAEVLREVQFNGDGFMTDKSDVRQTIQMVALGGPPVPAYIYQANLTPIAAGRLQLSAQGFTAGREFTGPITITGNVVIPGGPPTYTLLVSDPATITVRPLPSSGRLPGFTGMIGTFAADPPQLSTNRVRVGSPLQLRMAVHDVNGLGRVAPPDPPQLPGWQIIPEKSDGVAFTLIPLTDAVTATPAIPFSYFNPETARYVDLAIPAMPVAVVPDGMPVELPAPADAPSSAPAKLSDLAPAPGLTAASLKPLQLRGWFIGLQLLPVIGFAGLWGWDRRRRFLEAHPDIVRRRRARRALRRERRRLERAAAGADAAGFVRHAVNALRIAVAPHYPAQPQALVCADVLEQFDPVRREGPDGEVVRRIFMAADTQFAAHPLPAADLLSLAAPLDVLLLNLEERL